MASIYRYVSTATWTPAAAAYSANDVMSTAQLLGSIGPRGGGEVIITSTSLQIAHTAIISGETSYSLALYNVTPPSALADNAAFDVPSGDREAFLGLLSLGTPVDLGSTLRIDLDGINRQITVPDGGAIYAYLVTIGAFTATAAARKVTIHTVGT